MKKPFVILSFGLVIGLFQSCSSSDNNPIDPVYPSSAPKVTSIAGVIAKNAQGNMIGDVLLTFAISSKIEIDGIQSSKGDLQVGMTIEAEGELVNGNEFRCASLTTNSILRGNIDFIDLANGALVVGETTVVVDENASIANYDIGDAIKVFGNFVDGDKILASCLLKHGNTHMQTSYTAQGPMSEHNSQNKTFLCGKYIVDYSKAKLDGTPLNGGQVVASGPVSDGVMHAQTVYCHFYDPNAGMVGGWCVYGRMANWDPANNQFEIGNGYGCCCIYYWVNYDQWTPGIDLITADSAGSNFRIEGVLTQSGGKRVVKATKISK
ncbi:MAG: hypothetical protein LBH03_06235 [Holophagales bacterium]|nr:hypothetical protein [Holophagales bacterium]